jgi:hypothetical protein
MFLARLVLLQRFSITMETHKRVFEASTLPNRVCDRGTADDEAIIENAGERLETLYCS